jgi:hypothetical protein
MDYRRRGGGGRPRLNLIIVLPVSPCGWLASSLFGAVREEEMVNANDGGRQPGGGRLLLEPPPLRRRRRDRVI